MINIKEKIKQFTVKIKEKIKQVPVKIKETIIKHKGKFYLLCVVLLFILGFIVPIKFTYYWTLLELSLWSALFIFKERINYTHEETNIEVNLWFYKEWILNLCFISSIFYVFYIYMSGLALQFL